MMNTVLYKPPNKSIYRSENLKKKVAKEWVSFSYPTVRKLPVQKGRNTTGEARWFTV
jgi:hypothetical protein